MKRLQFVFALWMALVTAGLSQVKPAEVVAAYRDGASVRGYRLADECFVPIDRLESLGLDAVLHGNFVDLKAGDRTVSLPYRTFAGSQSVPLKKLAETMGAKAVWQRDRLVLYNAVVSLEVNSGQIRMTTALPMPTDGLTSADGDIALVGFRNPDKGTKFGRAYRIENGNPWPSLVIEGKSLRTRIPSTAPNVTIWADLSPVVVAPVVVKPVAPVVTQKVELPPVTPEPTNDLPDVRFNLALDIEGSTSSLLTLDLGGEPTRQPNLIARDPNYAEIEITGLHGDLPADFESPTELIKQIKVDTTESGSLIRLWFSEPVGVEFWKNGSAFSIQLLRPSLTGTLAGKTVVIDPGHGDQDTGAHFGNVNEKDLTLSIGRKLAAEMTASGARVIMTRRDDTFIPLERRAEIANQSRADLFISVHINSTAKVSMSGSITFYNGPNALKELLARCIQSEIAKVSQLPDVGAWSDKRLYKTKGLSVLRNTKMPGVLLELGFINHPTDRARMVTEDFQNRVAKAIVKGVKKFLGDTGVKSE